MDCLRIFQKVARWSSYYVAATDSPPAVNESHSVTVSWAAEAGLYFKSQHTRYDLQSWVIHGVARRVIVHAGHGLPSS